MERVKFSRGLSGVWGGVAGSAMVLENRDQTVRWRQRSFILGELGGRELQLTPEEAKTQICGLQVPNQSLPIETGYVDFGSLTPSLLLPQKGLKLTLGPAGAGDVPNPVLLGPAAAGCGPGRGSQWAGMGRGWEGVGGRGGCP